MSPVHCFHPPTPQEWLLYTLVPGQKGGVQPPEGAWRVAIFSGELIKEELQGRVQLQGALPHSTRHSPASFCGRAASPGLGEGEVAEPGCGAAGSELSPVGHSFSLPLIPIQLPEWTGIPILQVKKPRLRVAQKRNPGLVLIVAESMWSLHHQAVLVPGAFYKVGSELLRGLCAQGGSSENHSGWFRILAPVSAQSCFCCSAWEGGELHRYPLCSPQVWTGQEGSQKQGTVMLLLAKA